MLKKFILASAVLAATSSIALADSAPYIGAGLGIVTNTADEHSTIFNSYRGVPFNLFAGYAVMITDFVYLAGELDGTLGTAELSDNSSSLKTTYGYGLSIIPGVLLSDHTLGFVRAGVVRTRFSETNETRTGGQIGLGLQTSLTQNVDVRGEYDFTAYQSINDNGFSTSPRSDAFNLSLVYKFI